jgi:hypothetical protein
MVWSMFLKYLAKMDLILMLSKFSDQIGPKPKCFVFHSTYLTGLAVLMESASCIMEIWIFYLFHSRADRKLLNCVQQSNITQDCYAYLNTICLLMSSDVWEMLPLHPPFSNIAGIVWTAFTTESPIPSSWFWTSTHDITDCGRVSY